MPHPEFEYAVAGDAAPTAYPLYDHQAFLSQSRFFRTAFDQAATLGRIPLSPGPYYEGFKYLMDDVDARLKQIGTDMVPGMLMPRSYMPEGVEKQYDALPQSKRFSLLDLEIYRSHERQKIADLCAEDFAAQTIPEGLVDTPPYCHMGEGGALDSAQNCFNACFRMVFGALTGYRADERAVKAEVVNRFGKTTAEDDAYLNILKTPVFGEVCDKKVTVRSYIGCDLQTIQQRAGRIKKAIPSAEVYSIAVLGTEASDQEIWHTNILLGACEGDVHVIDPKPDCVRSAGRRQIDKATFAKRWAVALNRAHIVVAV